MVVRWPERITSGGGLRSQSTHVTDVGPTILEIAGIPQPAHVDGVEQQPMTGVTFASSLTDPQAPEHHTQQYFENFAAALRRAQASGEVPASATPEAQAEMLLLLFQGSALVSRAEADRGRLHAGIDAALDVLQQR